MTKFNYGTYFKLHPLMPTHHFKFFFLIKRHGLKVSKKFLVNSVFLKAMPYWA